MGMNSAPNPRPTMATLIFFMLCGRGAQSFDRTGCGYGVEYTDLRASCQLKRLIFKSLTKGRILELITEPRFQFCIRNSFVGRSSFAIRWFISFDKRRHLFSQTAGQPLKQVILAHGFVVYHIVNLSGSSFFEGSDERTHNI